MERMYKSDTFALPCVYVDPAVTSFVLIVDATSGPVLTEPDEIFPLDVTLLPLTVPYDVILPLAVMLPPAVTSRAALTLPDVEEMLLLA